MSRRVVITGIGVIAPSGIGRESFWKGMQSCTSYIRPIDKFDTSRYPTRIAGHVEGFKAETYIEPRYLVQTDRWTHFDMFCAQEAIEDAGINLSEEDLTRIGIILAAGTGGNEFGQKELHALWSQGPKYVSVYQSIAWFYAASVGQISIRHQLKGYGRTIVAEAAGGLMALAHAARVIRNSEADVILSGGSEAPISPFSLACFYQAQNITSQTETNAYRPFDSSRDGCVIGEGGAIFVLEELERARTRGAHIYGEIVGCGATHDGNYDFHPEQSGKQYAKAMQIACTQAGISPHNIDWIICDAQGTPIGDHSEAKALHNLLGNNESKVPVSAPKSMIGRLFNGASPVDVATGILGARDQMIIPTLHFQQGDEGFQLNLVTDQILQRPLEHIMVNARGFGGFNSSLVIRQIN